MIVVTAIGLFAAATSAGGAIGAMLPRPAEEPPARMAARFL
jgi:hypothetical protein